MLRKLYKYEFSSLYRIMLPMYAVLFGISGLTRLLSLFSKKADSALEVWKNLTVSLSIVTIVGIFVVGIVVIVVRFYQNLLSKQGYLTNTLPFKAHNHIVCKLICGLVVEFTNAVATVLSLTIMLGTKKTLSEIFEVLKYSFDSFVDATGKVNAYASIIELAVLLVFCVAVSLMMFYASMAIGQQFKNKILGSVIAYFCIYTAIQVINTVILVISMISGFRLTDSLIKNASFTALSQGFIIFLFIIVLIQGIIYFLITNYFLSKKLNLE